MLGGDDTAFDGHHDRQHPWREPLDAATPCPHCGSLRLTQRHLARRILGFVGTLAGAAGSGLRAWRGAEVGGALGTAAGPPGMALGAVAGAVLSALAGGSTGCAIGVRLGDAIDSRLLNDLRCQDCGHDFNLTTPAEA